MAGLSGVSTTVVGVQPQERRAGDAPQPPVAGGPPPVPGVPPAAPAPVPPQPAGTPRNRRKRLWLAMGLGIVALLCLGGVGVFVSLYDSATEIKRSAPDAVVDNFLGAYLVNRDDKEVALYTCKSGGDFAAISGLRTELINRERNFGVTVVVSWGSL